MGLKNKELRATKSTFRTIILLSHVSLYLHKLNLTYYVLSTCAYKSPIADGKGGACVLKSMYVCT
jgi:hypothetical protein